MIECHAGSFLLPVFLSSPSTIITTHLNTDFDAMASSVAASLLYAGSVIVLPGSMERPLREFMHEFPAEDLPIVRLRDVDMSAVRRLVVVDTCLKARIGGLAALLHRKDIEIIVYDHHAACDCDITATASGFFHSMAGANITLMIRFLRERGISISQHQATLFLAAIHEDTGSFTYASTTQEDLQAAAWLLGQGAGLENVARIINSRITPQHVFLLNDLLETTSTYSMGGIKVAIAKTSSADYVEDFSVLAHELMDMKQFPALFVIILMSNQVLIVGRSRTTAINTGAILKALGGGGHAMAASVTMKGVTLAEAEERLITAIEKTLGREPRVKDIMSTPVIYASPESPLYEVHDMINRYGISGIPVVEDNDIRGIISRSTVEKAIYHGLARLPVREYMSTDFHVLGPEAGISRVQELMVGLNQRFVPVVDSGRLTGVVTRTDLLRMLTEDPARNPADVLASRGQTKDISALLREKFSDRLLDLLHTAGRVAKEMDMKVYVVGGFVRDLLLRVPDFDIDLVVEGDGIKFARAFAEKFGARVREHTKFQTAVVIFPDNFQINSHLSGPFKVDVATARWEYYEYPAAMPTVSLSSIKLDLFRRDFTINTLAIRLDSDGFGTLIDFFGGQRDIKDGIIRVLHSLSFIEDPTRVFRAVRFEQRYGFRIGRHTLDLIRNAVRLNVFSRLSGRRLRRELRLMLQEPDPRPGIKRCADLDILQFIHPALKLTQVLQERLDSTYDVLAWYQLLFRPEPVRQWMVYLLALLSGLKPEEYTECINALAFSESMRRMLTDRVSQGIKALHSIEHTADMSAGEVGALLSGIEPEILLNLLAITGNRRAGSWLSRYITTLQDIRISITGDDLRDMGLPPGPVYRKIFATILKARLDGAVTSKDEELAMAAELIRNSDNAGAEAEGS